jgi:hypothetical protein
VAGRHLFRLLDPFSVGGVNNSSQACTAWPRSSRSNANTLMEEKVPGIRLPLGCPIRVWGG